MAFTLTLIAPDSGPLSGVSVTLTGTEFDENTTVGFDGVPARDVEVALDGLTLTAFAPQHSAGVVDVSVFKPATIPQTLAAAFEYVPGQWAVKRIDLRPRKEETA